MLFLGKAGRRPWSKGKFESQNILSRAGIVCSILSGTSSGPFSEILKTDNMLGHLNFSNPFFVSGQRDNRSFSIESGMQFERREIGSLEIVIKLSLLSLFLSHLSVKFSPFVEIIVRIKFHLNVSLVTVSEKKILKL